MLTSLRNCYFLSIFMCFLHSFLMVSQPPQMPEISDEEFKAAAEAIDKYIASLTPEEREELEQMTRKMLSEMGVDPDTLEMQEPLPAQSKKEEPAPVKDKEAEVKKIPQVHEEKIASNLIEKAQVLLSSIIQLLSDLQHRASLQPEYQQRFSRWGNEVTDCVYYLKVLSKKEHIERLLTPEFGNLYETIKKLEKLLSEQDSSLKILESQKIEQWDDPYEILGVSPDATDEEISRTFMFKKEAFDPEKLRQDYLAQGLAEQEIEREIKNAQLTFDLIKEHYLMLSTKESRALIDKERSVQIQAQKARQRILSQTLDSMVNAVSNALYQDQLLNQLELFMKKHEPKELEYRKKMEKEQEERAKEQKKMDELRAPKSIGVTRKPTPTYQREHEPYHAYQRSGGGSYRYNEPYYPSKSYQPPTKTSDKTGSSSSKPIKDSSKQKDEVEYKNQEPEEKKKNYELAQTQPEYQILATSMTELDQEINNLLSKLTEVKNVTDSEVRKSIRTVHNKLHYIYDKIKKADKRKHGQFKTFWKAIHSNAEELRKKLNQIVENPVVIDELTKTDEDLVKNLKEIVSQLTELDTLLKPTDKK